MRTIHLLDKVALRVAAVDGIVARQLPPESRSERKPSPAEVTLPMVFSATRYSTMVRALQDVS
jgi:hypothetical protein